jgi:hypothetical protein
VPRSVGAVFAPARIAAHRAHTRFRKLTVRQAPILGRSLIRTPPRCAQVPVRARDHSAVPAAKRETGECAVLERHRNNTSGAAALCSRECARGPLTNRSRGASRPVGTPGVASRGSLRRLFGRCPRPPGPLLDIAPNQSPHDLRRCRVLLGTQALEESLLARIDEDRQSCSAIFESHGVLQVCDRVR